MQSRQYPCCVVTLYKQKFIFMMDPSGPSEQNRSVTVSQFHAQGEKLWTVKERKHDSDLGPTRPQGVKAIAPVSLLSCQAVQEENDVHDGSERSLITVLRT